MTDTTALQKQIAMLEQRLIAALTANREAQQVIASQNEQLNRVKEYFASLTYNADGFTTERINPDFLRNERFMAAYRRGMDSRHQFSPHGAATGDLHVEWRAAIACWAGKHARHLPGDFVECGTNTGLLSLAVCDYIDFNSTGKNFYLFDTYQGIPLEQVSAAEDLEAKRQMNEAWYVDCYDIAVENFRPFPKAKPVRGVIPESLALVEIDQVCYLSIDLNIAYPEQAALAHFWPKLVPGAVIVFDDYGFLGHDSQKSAHDQFARENGVEIFALPTGQGLLIKP